MVLCRRFRGLGENRGARGAGYYPNGARRDGDAETGAAQLHGAAIEGGAVAAHAGVALWCSCFSDPLSPRVPLILLLGERTSDLCLSAHSQCGAEVLLDTSQNGDSHDSCRRQYGGGHDEHKPVRKPGGASLARSICGISKTLELTSFKSGTSPALR